MGIFLYNLYMKNLANEIRPETLKDVVGQKHLMPLLENVISKKVMTSFLFYGKPGIGKTTLASILAKELNRPYGIFNASKDSKATLVDLISSKEIIIIDEIHRLNKDKQDILLSYMEHGEVIVYGTTTENPYFIVNPAVRSRLHILELNPLDTKDVIKGLGHMIKKHELDIKLDEKTLEMIALRSSGDFRTALNTLDLITQIYPGEEITEEILISIAPSVKFYSDKTGDGHYDFLSAFHKSLRGSDVDAVLYYAAVIVKTGDIQGLYRRMLAFTYEDIGMANSQMGLKVDAAINAMERLGFPEAYQPLGAILTELALSPKSNSSYVAMHMAKNMVDEGMVFTPPSHLKDAHYASAKKLNKGQNYKYPHNYENNWVKQEYMPKELKGQQIFEYGNNANERRIKEYWNTVKNNKK